MAKENKIRHAELPVEISSKYLSEGFAKDIMKIYDVDIDLGSKVVQAKMDLVDPHVSFYGGQPEFYLSVITAYRYVNQLVNAYVCSMMGDDKQGLEKFFAIANEMKTPRPIMTPEGIEAEVVCRKDLERGGNHFMEFSFELQGGAFTGKLRGCGKR